MAEPAADAEDAGQLPDQPDRVHLGEDGARHPAHAQHREGLLGAVPERNLPKPCLKSLVQGLGPAQSGGKEASWSPAAQPSPVIILF